MTTPFQPFCSLIFRKNLKKNHEFILLYWNNLYILFIQKYIAIKKNQHNKTLKPRFNNKKFKLITTKRKAKLKKAVKEKIYLVLNNITIGYHDRMFVTAVCVDI